MEQYIIYIAGNPSAYPLEYYDPDFQAYRGVIPELLKQFSAQSEYDVRYYAPDGGDQRISLAANRQVDIISCPEDIEAIRNRTGENILLLGDDGTGQAAVLCLLNVAPDGLAGELRAFLSGISQQELTGMVVQASQEFLPQSRRLQRNVFWGMLLAITVLAAVLLYVVLSGRRKRENLRRSRELDPVTGIGNREYLERCCQTYLNDRNRVLYILFFFHLDPKTIVDGDEETASLRYIAAVLQNCASDTDILARVSDHGFALLRLTPGEREASEWLSAVLSRLREDPEQSSGGQAPGITVGVYPLKADDRDLNEILFFGLRAAQDARRKGVDYQFFNAGIMTAVQENRQLQAGIRAGLENREFQIYFQFCVDAATGRAAGAEVLVFWEHPEKGLLSMPHWLPLLEREGLAGQLDDYVFLQMCAVLEVLRRRGREDFFLLYRLSGRLPSLEQVAAKWSETSDERPAVCRQLLFGVPRDAVLSAPEAEALRSLGAGLVLEGFNGQLDGLMQSEDIRLCGLGLDPALAGRADTPKGRAALESMFRMGHALELFFLAGDVRTEAQAKHLRDLGCDLLCGDLYARPLPAWEAVRKLEKRFDTEGDK